MHRTGRVSLLVAAPFALALVSAGSAWACVSQPVLTLGSHTAGPSGSQVPVSASSIRGTAEIHWNAVDGPQVGTGEGPDFSIVVTVPQVDAGLYAVVLVERRPDGQTGYVGRADFVVTPPGAGQPGGSTGGTAPAPQSVSRPANSWNALATANRAGSAALIVVALGTAVCIASIRRHRARGSHG